MDEDDEEAASHTTLLPKYTDERLVKEGELNVATLEAYFVDVILICGFFFLSLIRKYLVKTFLKWEKQSGREIYDVHWKLITGYYVNNQPKKSNFLIKPLLKKDNDDEYN